MTLFKDHFSHKAPDYARYRASHPAALFEFLAVLVPRRELAWDVGTGNGQAAVELANYFGRVVASDASAAQIESATTHARITYKVMPAEHTDLADASVDLITVAQALHWFDFDRFYREAERVL